MLKENNLNKNNQDNEEKENNLENNENEEESNENKLESFKNEIKKIKEMEEKGELKTVHLVESVAHKGVLPEELNEEDMKIWQKFKDGTLTVDEFREYKRGIGDGEESRKYFAAFVANKLSILELKRYKEKIKEEKENEEGKGSGVV